MLIRIDLRSDTPIYAQIAGVIRAQIEEGLLAVGDRLPSARDLARSLDVNMHTVLKAYSALDSDGLVEMRRGRGGVVVTGRADLVSQVRALVSSAHRHGVSRSEVARLIEDSW